MSKWAFDPFILPQFIPEMDDQDEGPLFGFRVVLCRNERGVHLFLGWWTIAVTWVRMYVPVNW